MPWDQSYSLPSDIGSASLELSAPATRGLESGTTRGHFFSNFSKTIEKRNPLLHATGKGFGHGAGFALGFSQGKWVTSAVSSAYKTGGLKAAGLALLGPAIGIGFTVHSGYTGYKEGGIWGGLKGAAGEVVTMGMFDAAFGAVKYAGAAGIAKAGLAAVPYIGAVGAPLAMSAIMVNQMQRSWTYHAQNLPLQTAGITDAFNSSGAYTMRQRSLQAIQRSHLNARSAFGNEAQYMHISSYRGTL